MDELRANWPRVFITTRWRDQADEAAELANLAGKMIGSAKVARWRNDYALRKEAPTIAFCRPSV